MKSVFLILLSSLIISSFAQIDETAFGYYDYALRYAYQTNHGSPRMNALGGATTALGGDHSQHASNPAGLGFYEKSDFGFSLGYDITQQAHSGLNSSNQTNRLNVNSFGLVIADSEFDEKWRNNAISFSFNRLGSVTNPVNYKRAIGSNSLRNFLVKSANGTHYTSFANQLNANKEVNDLWGMAYHTFLLNENNQTTDPTSYFTFAPNSTNNVKETVEHVHRNMQYNFSYGGSTSETFYYGLTFSFRSIYERKKRTYTEIPDDNTILRSLSLNEDETSKGVGANLTFGFIYRPLDNLRIGISLSLIHI